MSRVKRGPIRKNRRKKILRLAKGYFGSKRTLYRTANEQVMRSLNYAYRDRKQRKREFRKLWIQRINAGAQVNGIKYSVLINGLRNANVEVNRKMLADLAVNDPKGFKAYCDLAVANLNTKRPEQVAVIVKTPIKPTKVVAKKDKPKAPVKTAKVVAKKDEPKAPVKTAKVVAKKDEPKAPVKTAKVVAKKDEPKAQAKTAKVVAKKDEPKAPAKTVVKKPIVADLSSKTIAELKEIAKEKGLSGYSSLKKADLITLINK